MYSIRFVMKNYKKLLLLSFTIVATVYNTYCQEYKNIPVIDNRIHAGKILNVFKGYELFPERKTSITNQLYFGYKTRGNKKWHRRFNFPEFGFSYFLSNLGNTEQFGYAHGIIPNYTTVLVNTNRIKLKYSIGFGLGYFTKIFDEENNPHNFLIGSHIMNMSFMSFYFDFKINSQFSLILGSSIIHGSNGHFNIPNGGINNVTGNFGIRYQMSKESDVKPSELTKPKKRLKFNINAGYGIHELGATTFPLDLPKTSIYTFSASVGLITKRRHNISIGLNSKYYEGFKKFIEKDSALMTKPYANLYIHTIFTELEFLFPHVSFFIGLGYNYHKPVFTYLRANRSALIRNMVEKQFSGKLGFRIFAYSNCNNKKLNPYIGIAIKTKFSRADYPEISFGVEF